MSGLRGSAIVLAHPTIVTAPGEEAQVDYGDGPMVRHPESGKYRRTRLFALTLAWSRKAVWLLVWKSSTRAWCELHAEAFRRLGGAVKVVVLDNLKEGVIKPDIYDPKLNPLYRDFLAHYDVVALPAKVEDPDRKGKVERSIDSRRALRSRANASRAWKMRRLTLITGQSAGRTRESTARSSVKWRPCLRRSDRT